MARQFTSLIGRLVQGDVWEMQTKDAQGNLRTFKSGQNIGQPNPQAFMALAFRKDDPLWPAWKAANIDAEAIQAWPTLHPGGVRIPTIKFSDKIIDGDGYDDAGKLWSTREGFAGHWIVRFTSGYAPKVYQETAPGSKTYVEITDKSKCKRGYFYRVAGTISSNDNVQKPGVYVNLGLVELVATGPEIVSGPDAASAFGGAAPAALPPGAGALPAATGPLPGGGAAPPPVAPPVPPIAPMAPAAPPSPSAAPAAPPPATPPVGATTVSPSRTMLPAANGATYEQLIGTGWTDALLIQHGMMVVTEAPAAPPPAPAAPPAPPAAPIKQLLPGQGDYAAHIAAGWTDDQLIATGKMVA